jgi:hypothetical protein
MMFIYLFWTFEMCVIILCNEERPEDRNVRKDRVTALKLLNIHKEYT